MLAIALWILLWVTQCHSNALPSTTRLPGVTDVVHRESRGVQPAQMGYFGPDNSHRAGYLRMPVSRSVYNRTDGSGKHRRGPPPGRPRLKRGADPGWGWEHLEDLLSGIAYVIERPITPSPRGPE